MKRIEKTAPPSYVDNAENLFKGWSPDGGSFDFVQESLIKKDSKSKMEKSNVYKACVYKAKADGNKDPEGFCKMEMEKAELGGPQQKEMGARTHQGSPDHEAGNLLDIVSRNAKEKLQEKMGQKKEVAVYQKSDLDKAVEKMMQMSKVMPNHGESFGGMKDKEKDMTVEDAKNLKMSPNWSAHKVMPIIHEERRDEALKYFNQRSVKKSESIDWESSEAKPSRILKK